MVSQFQRQAEAADTSAAVDAASEPLALGPYRIEATITTTLDFSAVARMILTGRTARIRWAPLELYDGLKIDSVLSQSGTRLPFYRHEKSDELWVRLDPEVGIGRTAEIRIAYHGDLLATGSIMRQFLPRPSDLRAPNLPVATDQWVFIKSTWNWFPRYGNRQRARIGAGMDWFFREWVDGTAIPTYTFSWKAEPAPDGRTMLKFRVRQEDVPADFFMPVPLEIELADGGRVVIRVNVRGASTVAQLALPSKPAKVHLNPLESVLANVKEEGWK